MIRYCRLAAALALLAPAAVPAQSYPAKSIRWISPFAPGGGADVTSRATAQKLTETWGQQVVVDNQGGAGGNIGVEPGNVPASSTSAPPAPAPPITWPENFSIFSPA